MGLDMYLMKKIYTDNQYKEAKEIQVGYWRKANAIHKWFVENVQEGIDNCATYYAGRESLEELLSLVNKVLTASKLVKGKIQNGTRYENGKETPIMEDGEYIENPEVAEELLPTKEGFFFGDTAYDQYYVDDLKQTKEILEKALADETADSFYYHSSW